jgi:hypothetical protein
MFTTRKMWQVPLASAQPLLQSLLWGEKNSFKLWVQHLKPTSAGACTKSPRSLTAPVSKTILHYLGPCYK